MRHSQRGVTFIGWLFLLTPVAILLYTAIRLVPVYLNYMRVAHSLTQLADEAKDQSSSGAALRLSLERRFDIEMIEHPNPRDVDIHREGDHWVAIADYEDLVPIFGNVSLVVQFHKQVSMQ
jgi:Domain of unknown function (DUF4845)